jgi:hypothetical protein
MIVVHLSPTNDLPGLPRAKRQAKIVLPFEGIVRFRPHGPDAAAADILTGDGGPAFDLWREGDDLKTAVYACWKPRPDQVPGLYPPIYEGPRWRATTAPWGQIWGGCDVRPDPYRPPYGLIGPEQIEELERVAPFLPSRAIDPDAALALARHRALEPWAYFELGQFSWTPLMKMLGQQRACPTLMKLWLRQIGLER